MVVVTVGINIQEDSYGNDIYSAINWSSIGLKTLKEFKEEMFSQFESRQIEEPDYEVITPFADESLEMEYLNEVTCVGREEIFDFFSDTSDKKEEESEILHNDLSSLDIDEDKLNTGVDKTESDIDTTFNIDPSKLSPYGVTSGFYRTSSKGVFEDIIEGRGIFKDILEEADRQEEEQEGQEVIDTYEDIIEDEYPEDEVSEEVSSEDKDEDETKGDLEHGVNTDNSLIRDYNDTKEVYVDDNEVEELRGLNIPKVSFDNEDDEIDNILNKIGFNRGVSKTPKPKVVKKKKKPIEVIVEDKAKDVSPSEHYVNGMSLRDFIRQNRRVTLDVAEKYFTRTQIMKEIGLGKVIKRGKRLSI